MEPFLIQNLIEEQRSLLMSSMDQLDPVALQRTAQALADTSGVLFFTGVGKSAFIAHKVAMTLVSCGCRAQFLSASDALHGDIGTLTENDCVVAFSRTGESDELIALLPIIKQRGAQLVTLVGNQESRLARGADFVVHTPYHKEVGPMPMLPTTSAAVQLIVGDLLVLTLLQLKQKTVLDFSSNHPGGQLGRRFNIRVCDLMLRPPHLPCVSGETKLSHALVELSKKRSGCVLIVDNQGGLEGIFTDGDLRRAIEKHHYHLFEQTMAQLMVHNPRTVSPQGLAYEALSQMEYNSGQPITVMPVVEKGQLVGLLRLHDILQANL